MQSPPLVAGIQIPYKRAVFGTLTTCTPYRAIPGLPSEGCGPYKSPLPTDESEHDSNIMVVVERGLCKFEDKAFIAHKAGATAVLVSNSKDSNEVRCFHTKSFVL